MDLLQIEKKLAEHGYKSTEQFERDMNLVFDNCIEYHGKDSGQCLLAYLRHVLGLVKLYVTVSVVLNILNGSAHTSTDFRCTH